MGTRSTTKIYEDGELILALYKQYDGYIDSWGKELKDFLHSGTFVNGFGLDSKKKQFNGAGCFALQLVTKFKTGVGDLYATTKEDEQEYNYKIEIIHDLKTNEYEKIIISCEEDKKYKEIIDFKNKSLM